MKIINKVLALGFASVFSLPVASTSAMGWSNTYYTTFEAESVESKIQRYSDALVTASRQWQNLLVDFDRFNKQNRQIPGPDFNSMLIVARNFNVGALDTNNYINNKENDFALDSLVTMEEFFFQINRSRTLLLTYVNQLRFYGVVDNEQSILMRRAVQDRHGELRGTYVGLKNLLETGSEF